MVDEFERDVDDYTMFHDIVDLKRLMPIILTAFNCFSPGCAWIGVSDIFTVERDSRLSLTTCTREANTTFACLTKFGSAKHRTSSKPFAPVNYNVSFASVLLGFRFLALQIRTTFAITP